MKLLLRHENNQASVCRGGVLYAVFHAHLESKSQAAAGNAQGMGGN